jgi:hypothetical protein
MTLAEKAKARRLRIRSKIRAEQAGIKERPADRGRPRRSILNEIAQRSKDRQG